MSEINKVDGIGAVRCHPLTIVSSSTSSDLVFAANVQAHGTELANVYGGGELGDYLIRFVSTLNPNGDGAFEWPQYTVASPALLTLNNGSVPLNITMDTYRAAAMQYLTNISLADPM